MQIPMHRQLTVLLCVTLCIVVYVSQVSTYTYGACELSDKRQSGGYTTFSCYKKGLYYVPQNIPLDIIRLNISRNKITRIKRGDFRNLTLLATLDISYNLIAEVDKESFQDLMSLTELDLSRNRLSRITKDLFHGLSNLKVLLLSYNNISTIEDSAFSMFLHLVCVKMSDNNITDMKQLQPIFRVQTLNEIHIPYNDISIFQSIDISNSSLQLRILNLAHNPLQIFRISADIFPFLEEINLSFCFLNGNLKWEVLNTSFLGNVKTLYIAGINVSVVEFNVILQAFNNSLSRLTMNAVHSAQSLINSTCQIPTVINLTLRDNKMRSLNRTGLEKCAQIKDLDLYYNSLSDLHVVASLKNLTSLKMGYNQFSIIPNMIQHLSMLEYIDFVFNQIGTLGCLTFRNLNNLKVLRLYGNRITAVKECVFQHLIKLERLHIGSNGIKFLDGAFKNGPSQMRVLEISSNSLTSLKTDDFRGLKSLTELILDDNKINSIDDGTFDALINLTLLNLQYNKITDESLRPKVFSGLSNLTILFLQDNHVLKTYIFHKPPFINLKSLKTLYLLSQQNRKKRSFLPYNLLQNLTCLDSFWAQNNGLKYVPDDLFKDNTQLTKVAFSKNYLITLSPNIFLPLQRLSALHLDGTRLKTLDFLVQASLHKLYYLQVSNNQITSINDTIVKSLPGLRLLNIQANTFTCDCSNAWFIKWVKEGNLTQVTAANKFECYSPPELKQTKLLHLDVHSCSVDIEFFCYISSMSLVLLTLVTSLVYHFLHWQIVYAYNLLLAFLYDKHKKGSKNSSGFQYDAFISYNIHNELWVTNELLPKLEGEQGWKLCLHHRDFLPGKPIVDNIVDGIYSSRKTICVISQHYLESEWCSREVQVASFRLFDEKKDVLILVFLEDIPVYRLSPYYRMRALVKKRTYLSWPKAGQDARVFWEKLRVALGARRDSEEENALTDVQNGL